MRMAGLPTMAEDAIQDVVQSVVDDIEYLMDVFMPDGRAFGMEKVSESDQLDAYLVAGLHDNVDSAAGWIRDHVQKLEDMMRAFGVPDDKIAAVHPYDIVETAALIWSNHMEDLLKERKSRIAPVEPSVPQPIGDETWPTHPKTLQ